MRSIDQLSLVSVLPTAVLQSLCSPLCSVMFSTNGCTARIYGILSVKSQTVGLKSSIFMVYLMLMPFTCLTVKSPTVRPHVSSFPFSLPLSELLSVFCSIKLYNYIFMTNLICSATVGRTSMCLADAPQCPGCFGNSDVMWFWEMVTTY